jgi:integrase
MRTGELMALSWKNINFETNKIRISEATRHGARGTTKTDTIREIDMLPVSQGGSKVAISPHRAKRRRCVFE